MSCHVVWHLFLSRGEVNVNQTCGKGRSLTLLFVHWQSCLEVYPFSPERNDAMGPPGTSSVSFVLNERYSEVTARARQYV